MPPGYKVRYCTLLTPGWCIANAHTFFPSYRSASAISLPFKRWENVPPIPFVIPRVSTPQDVFFQCQAYGALARVRLETSHRWCGGADGMCIETNSNPDGFCVFRCPLISSHIRLCGSSILVLDWVAWILDNRL
jgi:hypothetical protein